MLSLKLFVEIELQKKGGTENRLTASVITLQKRMFQLYENSNRRSAIYIS